MGKGHGKSMNSQEIIVAVVRVCFPPRRWAVCQNVSWSLLPYEADVIAVSKAGKVHEVEVKLTKADLKRDEKKQRWRMPPYIDCYWIAVPEEIKDVAVERANEIGAGVITVGRRGDCNKVKEPQRWLKQDAKPMLPPHAPWKGSEGSVVRHRGELRNQVWRLAALRYWDIVFDVQARRDEK
jgi:hypothetical protein